MEECNHFIMFKQARLFGIGLAKVADQRCCRMPSRAIRCGETGLHVEVCCVTVSTKFSLCIPQPFAIVTLTFLPVDASQCKDIQRIHYLRSHRSRR